ncbi:lytic transglycosylase domain-containing protein [Amaricoccus sp.]|uniref:lytic transglycosylase domain-containing protein n=1 Tax=Amaricoccus sp. TaxID=1872485 RepID=UPI001B4DD5E9|nr:lytic transglycosylase domain-containing protein [Amaricoccus sp.]MBP7002452.1 lytic transglycosylase domain-containing protein [Amaricoccus sp.]
MRRIRLAIFPLLCAAALVAPPAGRTQTADQAEANALAAALAAADAADWPAADDLAAGLDDAVAADVVLWIRLREGAGTWDELSGFLARERGWPGLSPIRRHAERAMPASLTAPEVIAFYAGEPPLTGAGSLRYAAALAASGRQPEADAEILRVWREVPVGAADQASLLAAHEALVEPLVVERLDMLLWRGLGAEAEALIPRAPEGWRKLAKARIAVRRDTDGLTAAVNAVPASLKDDPGLAYERYLYRVTRNRADEAEAFLIARSTSAAALGRPDMWMKGRADMARKALRRGDVASAYALAAANYGNAASGADYADAEWVAGFIALTRMDDPDAAAAHFVRFREAVATPISLGRAGYWLGLAEAARGDDAAAMAAWTEGGRYQTSFYGQLSAERAGLSPDPALAGDAAAPRWRGRQFALGSVVQAAQLLELAGDDVRATLFFRQAGEGQTPRLRAALAQMAADLGRPHLAVRIAKDAAADGVILPSQYYPLHAIAAGSWPVPTELALAIARQESEFNPEAVSAAGARGLMQLMPATAEEVSGKLGVPFEQARLTADPLYNATLGTAYLARMLRAYDGSYVLTAAAYNAGPGRVREWLAANGDPRDPGVDAVAWIEAIPFEETRNYVMRVMESLHVYRARLGGQVAPIRLASDIHVAG